MPAIGWQVDWTSLAVAATRSAGLPDLMLSARGSATKSATEIDATLSGAGLSLSISGRVPFNGDGLGLRANGMVPLALLAIRSERELRLAGTAKVDLTIAGSLSAPRTSGNIDLADATMADVSSSLGVVGAKGRVVLDGQEATIEEITARLAQGGDVTISGSASMDAAAGLPAELAVRVRNGRYSDGDMINAAVSADLTISGSLLGNGTISGRVDLGRTEIRLPDRIGGSATAIDVRHVNAPQGFTPPTATRDVAAGRQASDGGLNLDISLAGNSGVYVRGFGIDAEVAGALNVGGTTGNPQAMGGLELRRGRIEALGKRFDFTRGVVTFEGSLVPFVDFEATTRTSDAVVTLTVVGSANDPTIRFTSSPELPEEEILSRLLFERSVGRLSPLQAVQLVDAVAQLTGAAAEGGIFARIRQATGLDDLDIRQSETGSTTVGVGTRINENIRFGVEAGADNASGRVTIDLDITNQLKARGEAGQDGTGKIGLTFEREY